MGDLAREKRVCWEFAAAVRSATARARGLIFLAHVGDRQQDAREWREIVSVLGGGLQIGDAALLVGGKPPMRRIQRTGAAMLPMMYLLNPVRQQSVVAVGTNRQQLLRRGRGFFREVQRRQIALFDERGVVGLQS